jgi:glycosyltransferase involved in cell wall biosynthesis
MNNKKLLIIIPHCSTGGLPQFTFNQIELLKDEYNIFCVEYNLLSSHFVVQRNKIINLLGDKFQSVGDNKERLIDIIDLIDPDVIIIEEFSEIFMLDAIAEKLYLKKDRKYTILETTHSSNKIEKRWLPDKFIFVSEYSVKMYSDLGVPYEVIQYPIDKKQKDTESARQRLGLMLEYKHVVNVGLFSSGKNQGYAFEIARKLEKYKIKFHFIGNQAENFREYWEPIMKTKPDNCIIWGERDNIDDFLMGSDLFLFTSKSELNPLVIKESLCYDLSQLIFNLGTYCGVYNDIDSIKFLTGDVEKDSQKVIDILNIQKIIDEPEFLFGPSPVDAQQEIKEDFIFNNRNKLPQFLNKLGLKCGVEIGTFKGEFAKIILDEWSGKLYMVDVWRSLSEEEYEDSSNQKNHSDAYSDVMENIKGYEDRAFMLRMDSKQGSELFDNETLDFVYIDANHKYQFVKEDIEYWYPKVRKGGLFMGHDYIKNLYKEGDKDLPMMMWNDKDTTPRYAGLFGVTPAVNEFIQEYGYDLNITDEFTGTWWVIKK